MNINLQDSENIRMKQLMCGVCCLLFLVLNSAEASGGKANGADFDLLVLSLVDSLVAPLPHGMGITIGVLPFTFGSKGYLDDSDAQGRAIAEKIVMRLIKHPGGFLVVDRLDYEKALGEIALSQTGITEKAIEIEIGKFMSADYLISGNISAVMGQSAIRAKTVRVESGEVIAASEGIIGMSVLQNAASELFSEQQSVLSYIFRSAIVPGWGQFYAMKPVRGTASLVLCVGGAGASVVSWFATADRKNDRDSFLELANTNSGRNRLEETSGYPIGTDDFNQWFSSEGDRYLDKYVQALKTAKIATAVTAGFWILNIVDGSIAGKQKSRAVRLYFSGFREDYSIGLTYNF